MGNASSGGIAYTPGGGGAGGVGVSLSGNNTAGVVGNISSGTLYLAGGNNVTLSQNGQSITISGAAQGGVQTGISSVIVSNTTYTSGAISFSNANGLTWGSSAGQAITASYNSTQFAGLGSSVTGAASITMNSLGLALNVPATSVLTGVNGISISSAGSTISVSAVYQSIYITGNTTAVQSSSYYTPGALTISALGAGSIGWSAGVLVVSF